MTPPAPLYVSVIIPAYNEEGVIQDHIGQVADHLSRLIPGKGTFEIVVVNDGSQDATGAILDRLKSETSYLHVVHHHRNFGRGRALQTGFQTSIGQYVITLDADLSYTPDHIEKILAPLQRGEADVVLASAYHPQGRVENVPLNRALISRAGNKILAYAVGGGLRTVTCVVRGYTREVIDALVLFSDDKDIHLEIIQKVRILGYRILEVPAILKWLPARRSSAAKGMSIKDLWQMSSRHLFFNFLFRPYSLFMIPIGVLSIIVLGLGIQLGIGFAKMIEKMPEFEGWVGLYHALREHIIWAKISYAVFGLSLVLLLQFISLFLMSKQSNHHYEDIVRYFGHLERQFKNHRDNR
jgi:glycosyltransferase involved in cell wall biosynthesis